MTKICLAPAKIQNLPKSNIQRTNAHLVTNPQIEEVQLGYSPTID